MKNKFLLLVATLVLSTTATFASNTTTLTNLNVTDVNGSKSSDITIEDIKFYLEGYGIITVCIAQEQGTTNYLAKDVYGIWYRVYTNGVSIYGHDQVDM